ncbi:MAG: class I SAM-dependent methyltransferase [Lachnospiraceae bacterium]|nr:class I SAM-dependent methyltransferase [Lachnospiraceae bacterium]
MGYIFDRKEVTDKSVKNGYFSRLKTLDRIGRLMGTDKSSESLNYLNKYEFFIDRWRNDVFNLIELGVYKGASLAMWRDFFPNAGIFGIDICESCKKFEQEGVTIKIGDLGTEKFLDELVSIKPRFVLDDASHRWSHQIMALDRIFPHIEAGGIYVLEDIVTSFSMWDGNGYDDIEVSGYDYCQAIATVVSSGEHLRDKDIPPRMKGLIPNVEKLARDIEMVSFIQGSCILIKR